MLKIITAPNPVLTKVSGNVTITSDDPTKTILSTPDGEMSLQVLISVMVATMYANPCCGLAAPQLGVSRRVIVYNPDDSDEKDVDRTVIMINPVIVFYNEEFEKESESCLSLPGIEGNIKRHTEITVQYLDEDLVPHTKSVKDWEAKIIQHEIDHLNGKLFWDRLGPLKTSFMNKYRLAKRRNRHG